MEKTMTDQKKPYDLQSLLVKYQTRWAHGSLASKREVLQDLQALPCDQAATHIRDWPTRSRDYVCDLHAADTRELAAALDLSAEGEEGFFLGKFTSTEWRQSGADGCYGR